MVATLDTGRKCRTQFWKRTTQESFQQSLVEIGSVISEEKIFFLIKVATITKNRNFFKWLKLLYFKPESAQI
jgi:hypothetical protein